MEITTKQLKRCDVVKAKGRVDSQTAPQLAKAFDTISEEGRFRIVFDMTDVEFMSSAGLRVLINTQKRCKRFNRGQVILAAVPERIRGALDLAGFLPLFTFTKDGVEAVGSF